MLAVKACMIMSCILHHAYLWYQKHFKMYYCQTLSTGEIAASTSQNSQAGSNSLHEEDFTGASSECHTLNEFNVVSSTVG